MVIMNWNATVTSTAVINSRCLNYFASCASATLDVIFVFCFILCYVSFLNNFSNWTRIFWRLSVLDSIVFYSLQRSALHRMWIWASKVLLPRLNIVGGLIETVFALATFELLNINFKLFICLPDKLLLVNVEALLRFILLHNLAICPRNAFIKGVHLSRNNTWVC
jgi:hypothetical protein